VLDLHSHTTASDGALVPAELIALASHRGVATLAVTDHDTMAGVPEALEAGVRTGVRVISGIELSVRVRPGSMHLLGYFAEPAPRPLLDRLTEVAERRIARAERILARLERVGLPLDMAQVRAEARGPVGRPHIAQAMVAAGHVADRQEAFDRYLADGRPAHEPSDGLEAGEAVALVRESGGAPVLAHPATLALATRELDAFVQRLAGVGLLGLEVHRPDHTPERRARYARIARRRGLIACGGSDFHRPDDRVALGDTGRPPLPGDTLDRLFAAADITREDEDT
jgi:hypothetical protein